MAGARHVAVLGGGVVGVASAWYLARSGCRVTLIERRSGERIRVAGTAEFAGYDTTPNPRRIAHLRDYFLGLFSDYPGRAEDEGWAGLRPMTPDGLPYLGPTPIKGLHLNTGHGHLGWTMACGSANAVADLVCGRDPGIDLTGMTLEDR